MLKGVHTSGVPLARCVARRPTGPLRTRHEAVTSHTPFNMLGDNRCPPGVAVYRSLREVSAPPPPRRCPRCLLGRREGTLKDESCAARHRLVRSRWPQPMLCSVVLDLQMGPREAREGDAEAQDDYTHGEMCQMGLYWHKSGARLGHKCRDPGTEPKPELREGCCCQIMRKQ